MKKFVTLALTLAVIAGAAGWGCDRNDADSAASRVRESGFRGITLDRPTPKVDFTLDDTDGRPFHFMAETEGYITLLFFGYTHCPDVCPVHMANLAAVLKDLPWEVRSRIKVVFVSTDPARDTPARIRQWLDAFDPSFIGLAGTRAEVDRIMVSFGLPTAQIQGGNGTDYIVGHASQILAFGTDNVARLAYPFGTRQADWAHDLPRLARQGPDLRITKAVIAAPAGGGEVAALYLEIANHGATDDELLGVASSSAKRAELHRQVDHGGITTMEEIESLAIPAGGTVHMHPGGHHVMLLGIEHPLNPGETVPLELRFRHAGTRNYYATVVGYAELERALESTTPHAVHGGH